MSRVRDMIQDINRFSGGELKVVAENGYGAIAYHYPHQRQELVFPTRDLSEAAERISMGWQIKPGREGYLLRSPEEYLVDLSDPFKAQYGSRDNLALYRTVRDLMENGKMEEFLEQSKEGMECMDVYLLDGLALETEVRVAGSDSRIGDVKNNFLWMAKNTKEWEENKQRVVDELPRTRRLGVVRYSTKELSDISMEFYRRIERVHEVISPLYKPPCVMNGFWDDIPNSDVYIFVPKAGFKLALGFVDSRGKFDDVMFWEYHAGQTMSYEGQMFPKELDGKSVAIIDVSYSGTTLNELHRKVSDEGGVPVRVALFPKSRRAVTGSEYLVFLDKLRNSRDIELGDEWAETLYANTIREES